MDHVMHTLVGKAATWGAQIRSGVQEACCDPGKLLGHSRQPWAADALAAAGAACLAAARKLGGGVVRRRGGSLLASQLDVMQRGMAAAGLRGDNVRVLIAVRDPLEIIESAYFYHVRGPEPAQRTTPSLWVDALQGLCEGRALRLVPRPPDDACHAIRAVNANTTSYAALLQQLPPRLGILAEAANSYSDLPAVASARDVAKESAGVATVLELADVFDDFDAALGAALRFLRPGVHTDDACIAALRPLDISRVRTEGGHDACVRANAPVEVRSRLSALLARLAPPWGNVMSRAGWYADLVEPLRALTPPACSDKHVSDPELGPFRQELGRLLRASDYFTQHIEPLRRKGGYIP